MIHDVARERARALEEKYGWWGRHPDYLLEDWQQAVANDDTRLGYWDWVAVSMSAAAEEEDDDGDDDGDDDA